MLELKKRLRKKKTGPPSLTYYISGTYQGHRVRESLRVAGRETAQRKFEQRRKEIIDAIDAGHDPDLRFATAATEYIDDEQNTDTRFLEPLICELGEERVADLTTPDVHKAAKKLYPKAKNSTLNRQVIAPLVAVVNYCAEKRMCGYIKIKRFPEGEVSRRAVTHKWVDTFRAEAIRQGHAAIGDMELFMFTTAARLGDAQKLDWKDVRIEERIAVLRDTKNQDDRDAILTPEMARALAARRPREARGRVFGDWHRRHLYRLWQRICAAAGLDYVPPHQAGRHSFGTEMIVRNKVDAKTTAKVGGWRSVALLLKRYAHPEAERQVVEEIFGDTKENRPRAAKTADTNSGTSIRPFTKKAGNAND